VAEKSFLLVNNALKTHFRIRDKFQVCKNIQDRIFYNKYSCNLIVVALEVKIGKNGVKYIFFDYLNELDFKQNSILLLHS